MDWVECLHVAFHLSRPAAEEAAFRREVLDQDLSRTLGAVDGERGRWTGSVGIGTLGAISLGGQSLSLLADAGRIDEHTAGALTRAEQLFRWPVTPWCSAFF